MKNQFLLISFFLVSITSFAQVGIGTATPKALLDVVVEDSSAPKATDGILVPRIDTFPSGANLPTSDQIGMIVYLTTADGSNLPGFYFYNGSGYINVTDAVVGAFNTVGTSPSTPTTNAIQNAFRLGTTSIGAEVSGAQLNVTSPATGASPRTSVAINNNNNDGSNNFTYGINLTNNATGTGIKYGINSSVTGSGNTDKYGIRSSVAPANNANRITHGIYSDVGGNTAVSSTSYGLYSEVGSSSSRGTNYAIYGYSNHGTTTTDPSYSGYFRGDNFAIRSEDNLAGYNLPTTTGTTGQVLTTTSVTDGIATTAWQSPATVADSSNNNEGILNVGVGGANDSQIISTNGSNSTNVTIAGGNGINITENTMTRTVTVTNSMVDKNIVTLNLWGNTASLYGISPNNEFVDRAGIQGVFNVAAISTTGNLELRLVVDQQDNATGGATDYQLRAFNGLNIPSTPISTTDMTFTANGVTGAATITTNTWMPYNVGSTDIVKFIIQARNSGSTNANVRSAYLMIRNKD